METVQPYRSNEKTLLEEIEHLKDQNQQLFVKCRRKTQVWTLVTASALSGLCLIACMATAIGLPLILTMAIAASSLSTIICTICLVYTLVKS